jgi:hypothetical protein
MPARWEPWPGNTTVVVEDGSLLRTGIELGTGHYMREKLTSVKYRPVIRPNSLLKIHFEFSSYAI